GKHALARRRPVADGKGDHWRPAGVDESNARGRGPAMPRRVGHRRGLKSEGGRGPPEYGAAYMRAREPRVSGGSIAGEQVPRVERDKRSRVLRLALNARRDGPPA